MSSRFDRGERFFGKDGQAKLRTTQCLVVGSGGLGTPVIQQLAFLGVGGLHPLDYQELDVTNKGRYIGSRHSDPIPGTRKVDSAERLIKEIDPTIEVRKVHNTFISTEGFAAIRAADYVFGCLHSEGARLILNEICSVYERPYFDLATEIMPADPPDSGPPIYGGRVFVNLDGSGCLACMNVLDMDEADRDLRSDADKRNRERVYGIDRQDLGDAGPSVVSINGVVASLAVTEFLVHVTGIRQANRHLEYKGNTGKVFVRNDKPFADCYYCVGLRGKPEVADLEQHIRNGLGERLR